MAAAMLCHTLYSLYSHASLLTTAATGFCQPGRLAELLFAGAGRRCPLFCIKHVHTCIDCGGVISNCCCSQSSPVAQNWTSSCFEALLSSNVATCFLLVPARVGRSSDRTTCQVASTGAGTCTQACGTQSTKVDQAGQTYPTFPLRVCDTLHWQSSCGLRHRWTCMKTVGVPTV